MRLPFDASGLAPSTRKKSVRSMSGIGNAPAEPNRRHELRAFGSWSTLVAENRDRVGAVRLADPQKACRHEI
jgi:hypothetical protein